ncbi:hypothetical protein ACP4OV_006250 [Aristida adscensionis]
MSFSDSVHQIPLLIGSVIRPGAVIWWWVAMRHSKRMKTVDPVALPALPDEIMTEVLLRLPVKSLIRFRAVCRTWAATISSDEFCTLHMARAEDTAHAAAAAGAPPKLLLVAPTAAYNATAMYSCSPRPRGSPGAATTALLLTLDDLRGGLVDGVAAQCRGLSLLYDAVAPAYYVFNAATRAATRLPPCEDVIHASAGLGFDDRAKEYKVVRLFVERHGPGAPCEVYTLGGGHGDRWRPAAGGVPPRLTTSVQFAIMTAEMNNLPPVLANGSLHWLTADGSHLDIVPAAAIVTFSIAEETFGCIESLPFVASSGVHLVELGGCLSIVRDLRRRSSDGSSTLEIWKLQDYTSGIWLLHTRIDLSQHTARDLLGPSVIRVLGAIGDGRSAQKIIVATSDHTVHAYDVMSRNVETIFSVAGTGANYQTKGAAIRICLFQETLAPVHATHEETSFSSPSAKTMKEILHRLPPRSIVQFKLVCNQWRRFIENKSFIHSYFEHKNMQNRIKIMLASKGAGRSFFHFTPLEEWLPTAASKGTRLDTKVVCSKPCHGLNLLITAKKDYLYNPCTGYRKTQSYPGALAWAPWEVQSDGRRTRDEHAFTIGNKNVGLGFNPVTQEHVAVIILYEFKNYESREYYATCSVWHCGPGCFQPGFFPPLPVNDMPPAHVAGVLYWMSDPRLGPSTEHAIVSFDIATSVFHVIPCPSHVAEWSSQRACRLFVAELWEKLCVVLADLMADELVVWKLEHGEWSRACTVCLKASPDYSVASNVVVPLAVDPKDGRILLSTGRKIGLYDPVNVAVEELFAADEIKIMGASSRSKSSRPDWSIAPYVTSATAFVPMLYEESLASYPLMWKERFQQLFR